MAVLGISNMRPFQVVLLGVFIFMAFMALVLISGFSPEDPTDSSVYGNSVVIWGTLDARVFDEVFTVIKDQDKAFGVVDYYEISEFTFDSELINAIAEGRSPDLIIMTHDQLVTQRSKLLPIPYENFSERTYRDLYVDGAEIFARPDGIYALPFAVDPIVMYWNRDMFASNGLATAPTTWENLVNSTVPLLTKRDTNRNIVQSAVAFGEARNVRNTSEVLSLLALQSGSRMVEESNRGYVVALNDGQVSGGRPPLEAALQFYTDFSDAASSLYSWNRAQPEDRSSFIAGDLAMYFGYGSEAELIADRNPNLNFDVTEVPQGAGATIRRTHGQFYAFAIPRAAGNASGAYAAARTLTNPQTAAALADQLLFAPVHRSALSGNAPSAFYEVVWNSALIARGWLDPNPSATDAILQTMVEDVVSNRARVSSAVSDAVDRITLSF